MNWDQIRINPEFVDMVIRTVNGEPNIHDVMTHNPDAAAANILKLDRMRKANGHLVAQICKSQLFQNALFDCVKRVSETNDSDQKRTILAVHVAQAILIGMHMQEQLVDKGAKGLSPKGTLG